MRRFFKVALALASTACSRSRAVTGTQLRAASAEVPIYEGSVAVDPASQRLSAKWSIRFVVDSATTDSVVFLLNAGLAVSRVSGQTSSRLLRCWNYRGGKELKQVIHCHLGCQRMLRQN